MFRFEHPTYLYALVLIPVLTFFFYLTRHARLKALLRFGDKPLVHRLMPQVSLLKHPLKFGKLMLALVMVWTYFNLSQFLIIYSGNIPEETPWYLTRMSGGWQWVGLLLLFFHFVFPFLLLLSRDIKRSAKWISLIAVFILIMRLIDMFYHIGPTPFHGGDEHGSTFHLSWMDFVGPIAVGGLWLAYFFYELKKRPLVPHQDPFYENAIKHGQQH